jgi:DNA primase
MRFLFLPAEDDPDSFVRKHGQDAFEKLAREAQTLSGYLLGQLRAEADLATAEGRSKFLTEAKPHLQKLTAPGLKLQLIKEVADLAGVSQGEAEGLMEMRSPDSRTYRRPAPSRVAAPRVNTNEQRLLRCVIVRPELVAELDFALLDERLPETDVLAKLADRAEPELRPQMLIEHFRDSGHEDLLAQTLKAIEEQGPDEDSAGPEFQHTLVKLRIKRKEQECDDLKARADANRALVGDYQQSLAELHQLKRQLNAPGP